MPSEIRAALSARCSQRDRSRLVAGLINRMSKSPHSTHKKTRRRAPGLQSSICKSLVQESKKMQTDDDDERNTCQPKNDVTSHYANS